MKFSEDRIRHVSHAILDELEERGCIETLDRAAVLGEIKRILFDYFRIEDEVDDLVRNRIRSYSRGIAEGSREWDIMYTKLFEEEMNRRGFPL